MDPDKQIKYIAKHYRRGLFSVNAGWKHLGIATSLRIRRLRAVAAAAGVVILTATAAVIYSHVSLKPEVEEVRPRPVNAPPAKAPENEVKIIDFDNTPLPVVTRRIQEVYGVEVINLPENADDYVISLHYEGNAVDLVQTINEILDTRMSVKP